MKFSIRDLFWLITLASLIFSWWHNHQDFVQANAELAQTIDELELENRKAQAKNIQIQLYNGRLELARRLSKPLAPLPDQEGVAGALAGVSDNALIVAGGANFPDKKPWEGGKKVWYDTVYALDKPSTKEWKVAGKLPRPLAYGVSVTHNNDIVCVGGSDAERHYADAFRLQWQKGKLNITALPPLPQPLANACGALVRDVLYIAGGQEQPDSQAASKTVWKIDLAVAKPMWEEVPGFPGSGRILATAASTGGAFWIAGGAELFVDSDGKVQRRYLQDAYRYDAKQGWERIADLPHPIAAAPSPTGSDATGFFIFGGDDGSQVATAPDKHRGFSQQVLRYDVRAKEWVEAGDLNAGRVTAPCVQWNATWVIPSGEMRPGLRSPEVWSWKAH